MKKVFKLFISSTFDDFKLERAALQKFVGREKLLVYKLRFCA